MTIDIMTLAGTVTTIDDQTMQEFRNAVRGDVLTAADEGYEEALILHNGMIDRQPALAVRCTGAADVMDAVRLASDNKLLVAVKGGGHGVAGNALCDGGLLIDLSLMRGVHVDAAGRTARVQGGAMLGDLDRETQAFALVAPAGVVSETGVAGLTLGGGFGWVRAKHGLSIDNLLSVDIVTADGQLRCASETDNEDLFWAIRGGGGNFGVVTSFEFQLHPLGPIVMFCSPMYAATQAKEVLRVWRDFMAVAPDDFSTEFFFWTIPEHPDFPAELHGEKVVVPAGVYAGPADEGERFVQPLREIGTPILDLSGPMPFTQVQQTFDAHVPKGMLNYWKALYLDSMDEDVMDALVSAFEDQPPGATRCPFVLQALGGASCRVPDDATAFGDRSRPYMIEINSSWTDPADSEFNVEWTRQIWEDMRQRFSRGGGYLNMSCYNEDGEVFVKDTYGPTWGRLREIKKKYDPANLFRMNYNIPPAE